MRSTRTLRVSVALGSLAAFAAACSLVNSFDELLPEVPPDAAALADGTVATPDGSTIVGADAALDAAMDAAVPASEALLVASGLRLAAPDAGKDSGFETDQPVLTALDPATGREITSAQEALNVEAILYDGAPDRNGVNRDLWFIFENKGEGFIYPLPTDKVVLHVRQFDREAKKWSELSTLEVPPLVSTLQTTLVSNSVVFVAYKGSASAFELVSVDTTNPSAPTVAARTDLTALPIALLGARSSTGSGGKVVAAVRTGGGPQTKLSLEPYLVTTTGMTAGATTDAGVIGFGSPALASYVAPPGLDFASTEFLVATRRDDLDAGALQRFSSATPPASLGSPTTFALKPGASQLKPLAVAPCENAAFAIETNTDLALHVAQIQGAGFLDVQHQTGHSGQSVVYEPYTHTALAPFSQGDNFALTAVRLSQLTDGGLTAQARADWTPPSNVRFSLLTPRVPLPYAGCSETK